LIELPIQAEHDVFELGKKLGYLPNMIERYLEMLGEKGTEELISFNETTLPQTIRLNTLRSSYENTETVLVSKGIELRKDPQFHESRTIVQTPYPIGATPEYLNGYYMLQGKNSLYPARVLNPSKDELVGDFAAAPGGKTTHLAQIMANEGNIMAVDISANRCRSLKSNISRMGVINTIVLQMDSRKIASLNLQFDKILLDAPCSGSGIIISDVTRKSSKTMEDIMNYHDYQVSLLSSAIEVLKTNGELVYCTCSLEPEENELVISKILEKTDVKLDKIELNAKPGITQFQDLDLDKNLVKAKRLYPHETKGEGFFIAKLVKENE
jgi:NOL1/NOP2/sun family putative RNA methylase